MKQLTEMEWERISMLTTSRKRDGVYLANETGWIIHQKDEEKVRQIIDDIFAQRFAPALEPQPAPPVEPSEADMVEQMCKIVFDSVPGGKWPPATEQYLLHWRKGMAAALAFVRALFAAHPPAGLHTTEQVEKAVFGAFDTGFFGRHDLLRKVKANLNAPKLPTEQERELSFGMMGYTVYLHGSAEVEDGEIGTGKSLPVTVTLDIRDLAAQIAAVRKADRENSHAE